MTHPKLPKNERLKLSLITDPWSDLLTKEPGGDTVNSCENTSGVLLSRQHEHTGHDEMMGPTYRLEGQAIDDVGQSFPHRHSGGTRKAFPLPCAAKRVKSPRHS